MMPTIVVLSGYGLMRVVDNSDADHVSVIGHGPPKSSGHWFPRFRVVRTLTESEAREALQEERKQAAARKVACNNPDCWCLPFLRPVGG